MSFAFISARRRFTGLSFSALSACLGALILSGCSGGSGGGNGGPGTRPTPTSVPGGVLLSDDFASGSLNSSLWGTYDSSRQLQRTGFGLTPQLLSENGTTFARLNLNTYNPGNSNLLRGTEMFSRSRFVRGDGLEFETRVRGTNIAPGVVFAAFMIHDRYIGTPSTSTYRKTEVDYEFLGAALEQLPAPSRNFLYLNIWNDWNELIDGYDQSNNPDSSRLHDDKTYGRSVDTGFDWGNWNVYRARLYPDRTEFYVNDRLERTEREVIPQQAMSVHFNIWAGLPDFAQAYSPNLQPTNSAGNRNLFFDVDYVRVRSLGSGGGIATGQALSQIPKTITGR